MTKAKKVKNSRLASKIAAIIGAILVVIFVVFILFSATASQRAIQTSTFEELTARAQGNAANIETILNAANNYCENVGSYMTKAYEKDLTQSVAEPTPAPAPVAAPAPAPPAPAATPAVPATPVPAPAAAPATPAPAPKVTSELFFGLELTSGQKSVEQYLTSLSSVTAQTSPDIVGCGVFFEKDGFTKKYESYSIYAQKAEDAAKITSFGNYASYSQSVYYQEAVKTNQKSTTNPYLNVETDTNMVSFVNPFFADGKFMGTTTANISLANFDKIKAESAEYPSLHNVVLNQNDTVVYHSLDKEMVSKTVTDLFKNPTDAQKASESMKAGKEFVQESYDQHGNHDYKFFAPIATGANTWWVVNTVGAADLSAASNQTALMLIVFSVVALILLVVTTLMLLSRQLKPINAVVKAAENMAAGNLQIDLKSSSTDEIGRLSRAFDATVVSIREMIEDISYVLTEMASGNFNVETKAEERYIGDFEPLIVSMRGINVKLSEALSQINNSAEQVSSGSDQVSSGAQALSQGATQQASSVEELAATITEISGQVKKTAMNALEAKKITDEAGIKIQDSNDQMVGLMGAMKEISDSSSQIGKIIKTIEDIAFQTNILALNAAVEAARAGEAGKGFAVVADEVRNLASKSAEASKSTAVLIENSMKAVKNGTNLAKMSAESLNKVVISSNKVVTTVDKISDAANEQASSIAQVTLGIDQISSVVQTNSATAEESAAASEELSGQAQILKSLVAKFTLRDSASTGTENLEYEIQDFEEETVEATAPDWVGDKY